MRATIRRIKSKDLDPDWDGPIWKEVSPLLIGRHMGERPDHIPRTQVKIAYDDEALHLIFQVEDRYVRAVAETHQSGVCRDSCVEFFFTPGTDTDVGYFNLEMNCGGTMLFHFQQGRGIRRQVIPEVELRRIQAAHSLPRLVDPEIEEPVTWTVTYRLPTAILESYCSVQTPATGVVWRANFYKCADQTSHPHWLTWAKVDRPLPDFHQPGFFGLLEFV